MLICQLRNWYFGLKHKKSDSKITENSTKYNRQYKEPSPDCHFPKNRDINKDKTTTKTHASDSLTWYRLKYIKPLLRTHYTHLLFSPSIPQKTHVQKGNPNNATTNRMITNVDKKKSCWGHFSCFREKIVPRVCLSMFTHDVNRFIKCYSK